MGRSRRIPTASTRRVDLAPQDGTAFAGAFTAGASGVYQCRVRAVGRSRAGYPFRREQTLTAAVWQGADSEPGTLTPAAALCRLIECALEDGRLLERLKSTGVDVEHLLRCACGPDREG